MNPQPRRIHVRLRAPAWAALPPRQSLPEMPPPYDRAWQLDTLAQMAENDGAPERLELFLHPARCLLCLLRWTPRPGSTPAMPIILPFSPADFLAVYLEVTINAQNAPVCGESETTLWLSPAPAAFLSDTPGIPSHHFAHGAVAVHS